MDLTFSNSLKVFKGILPDTQDVQRSKSQGWNKNECYFTCFKFNDTPRRWYSESKLSTWLCEATTVNFESFKTLQEIETKDIPKELLTEISKWYKYFSAIN